MTEIKVDYIANQFKLADAKIVELEAKLRSIQKKHDILEERCRLQSQILMDKFDEKYKGDMWGNRDPLPLLATPSQAESSLTLANNTPTGSIRSSAMLAREVNSLPCRL